MTRDEIYNHLAKVYLGKREKAENKKKRELNVWLVLNIFITVVILASSVYGLTAFLATRDTHARNNILFALHNGPIRVKYNLQSPYPQVKTFSLSIPQVDATKYNNIQFSIRGADSYPDIVKVVVTNQYNEISSYFAEGIGMKWKEFNIPFASFKEITNWGNLTDISFVFEAWNIAQKEGTVLIDNLSFAN